MAEVGLLPPGARVELIEERSSTCRRSATSMRLGWIGSRRVSFCLGESAFIRIEGPVRLSALSDPRPDLTVLRPRSDEYRDSPPAAADVMLIVEIRDTALRYDRDETEGAE
jgi:hypothetical protein